MNYKEFVMRSQEEIEEILDIIREKVCLSNREETLDELLSSWDIEIKPKLSLYEPYKNGKILIIGQSTIDKNTIIGIAKSLNIDNSRLELVLDYRKAENYDFRKLQYNPLYRVIIVGPLPHKTAGTGCSSSVITEIENKEGYPRIVRSIANQELKITKSSIRTALSQLLNENYI